MIRERLDRVKANILEACLRSKRDPSDVKIMAVTKKVESRLIQEIISLGIDTIGENQVQEARTKSENGAYLGATLALIGHLQTNKASVVTRLFHEVHSVDSERIANELSKFSLMYRSQDLGVLVEVNAGRDPAKWGVTPEEAPDLVRRILDLPGLRLRGFLTVAPAGDLERAREAFRTLRRLRDDMLDRGFPHRFLRELSMGMSSDYEIAVEEGSTIVRLGTVLFGPRSH